MVKFNFLRVNLIYILIKKVLPGTIFILSSILVSAQSCGTYNQQCTASGLLVQPGIGPSYMQATPLLYRDIIDVTLEFLNFDSLVIGGNRVRVDSTTIKSINNLPAGVCWQTNKATHTFGNKEDGCISVTGIMSGTPGQYKLDIELLVYSSASPAPHPLNINAGALGLRYFLRVNCYGAAIVPVDTFPNVAESPAFIPYHNFSCVSPPWVVLTIADSQTVCNNSVVILTPSVADGTPPYTYSWQSTGNALSCNNCLNPRATITQNSVYTVAVTDANNFVAISSVHYFVSATNNLINLSATNTNLNCYRTIDTTTLNINNATPPFTIYWGTNETYLGETSDSQFFQFRAAGLYPVTVVDSFGCTSSIFDTVLNNGIGIGFNNAVQPNCWGTATGSLQVTASGGTPPYNYEWNNIANTNTISNIVAGNYEVTVTDSLSCSANLSYYLRALSDPWGYYVYLNSTPANCANNGQVIADVYGGLPPFAYLWSNGNTTQNLSGLSYGFYNVTISDSAGCQTRGSTYVESNCTGYITGRAFVDNNNDCIYNTGDIPLNYLNVSALSSAGTTFYGSTDNNGYYAIAVTDTGLYSLSANTNLGLGYAGGCATVTFCGNPLQKVFVAALGDSLNNVNIGISNSTGFNLGLNAGWTSGDPGFVKQYSVTYYNSSATAYNGPATITFVYDSNLVYLYSDETPAPVADSLRHTLIWTINSIPDLLYYSYLHVDGYFQVPASLDLNYLLQSDFTITPLTGDCDSSDNHYHYSETVIGSHDPNEKTVSPAGPVTEADSVLTYTIHFQNTGTDSTHFVIIKDTLSASLDAATVRNIASSDKYSSFTITGKGILTWTFNPLRIVDSATNPDGSKRFVMFTVKKKANLPVGTTINNTASIYFDYNDAVVTNTVRDTAALPVYIFEVANNTSISISAFPNPFNDVTHVVVTGLNEKFGFELYDVTGRLQQTIPSINNNQFDVHRDKLASGVYLYRILVTGKPAAYGKLVVQ